MFFVHIGTRYCAYIPADAAYNWITTKDDLYDAA